MGVTKTLLKAVEIIFFFLKSIDRCETQSGINLLMCCKLLRRANISNISLAMAFHASIKRGEFTIKE